MSRASTLLLAGAALFVACGGAPPTDKTSAAPPEASAAPAAPSGAPTSAAKATPADADAASEASDEDGSCSGAACIKQCDAKGRQRDCESAGEALRNGSDGVTIDEKRAATYLQKACDLKSREACYRLADLLQTSEAVPHDDAKALKLLGAACDLGRGDACDQLSKRAEAGEGVPKDHKKAMQLLIKGCVAEDYQVWTCNRLREAAEKKDPDAAKALAGWKTACAAKKDATACAGVERTTKKP